jgi:sulfide:quinone oxidoreductase
MNESQTVVVLGGGVGGLVTANTLRKLLPRQHRIVLVEREENHLFSPSLLWLMTGRRNAANISRPLERLSRKGIEVLRGDIQRIEPEARRITVNGKTVQGEHLVIALGAELAPASIPGLPEAGHNFYTLAGAESLRDALRSFHSGKLVVLTATPAYKCPAAPYEAAMLLEYDCRKRGVRDRVQVDLYAAEPVPMAVTGPVVSAAVRQMVEKKGIAYHPEHQVTSVDAKARRIVFANDRHAEFDLLAYVPPHRAPAVVREAGLVAESGWVPVDRNTLETKFPGVYAIGDVTGIPLKMGKPLPKAGVFAELQGKVVAHNIARAITGTGAPARFEGYGECFIETGDGQAGFGKGNFYAEPTPQIALKAVGYRWHIGKVLFEKMWLRRWF